MKKLIGIGLILAMMLTALSVGVVSAAGPIVEVVASSPGGIGSSVEVTTTGIDTSTCNPGKTGEVNSFTATGQFDATYKAYTGNYGKLSTYVNAVSSYGGEFTMKDTQDFDILSGNHNYHTVGDFTVYAGGSTAAMNLKSIGSMYCWSEATNGGVGLQGDNIYKSYDMYTNGFLTSTMLIQAIADGGLASITLLLGVLVLKRPVVLQPTTMAELGLSLLLEQEVISSMFQPELVLLPMLTCW